MVELMIAIGMGAAGVFFFLLGAFTRRADRIFLMIIGSIFLIAACALGAANV